MVNIKKLVAEINNKNSKLNSTFFDIVYNINNTINTEEALYNNWLNYFKYCYGDITNDKNSANAKKSIEKLNQIYKSNIDTHDIYKFLYSLQSSYIMLLKLIVLKSFTKYDKYIDKHEFKKILSGQILLEDIGKEIWNIDWFYLIVNYWDKIEKLINKLYKFIGEYDTEESIYYYVSEEFKKLYEYLFPKEIRHSLGEYYTPTWLSQDVYDTISKYENINSNSSLIDPTCGSGVFLETILKNNEEIQTENIYGFDLNIIAVLTSKIVILYNKGIEAQIKIYQNDILMYPDLVNDDNLSTNDYNIYIFGNPFSFPKKYFKEKSKLKQYLKDSIKNQNTKLYKQLSTYDDISRQIFINILNDRIESIFVKNIDFVVGNPPWINWEYLPTISKELTKKIWIQYNLFEQNGKKLSFSKEDISLLVTYIVIDKILKNKGILGFIIRIGTFKSKQNGIGFRNFKIGRNGDELKVLHVDDYSSVNAFPGAINTACVAYIKKGVKNEYPVSFSTCSKINEKIVKTKEVAIPTTDKLNSIWITMTPEKIEIAKKVLGANNYKARTGVFTGGANAVYWIKIIEKLKNGNLIIENITERAKRKAPKIRCEIENELVYELCRGSELGKKESEKCYIICPHTSSTKMKAINIEIMKDKYPKTFKYLLDFKDILDDRKGFASWEKANQEENFYSIQRIGEYSFKKYKVAWKYISKKFEVFIISDTNDSRLVNKTVLPSEKIMYVSLDNEEEANYLAGILNSKMVRETVEGFMTETSISTHVLDKLQIEDFNRENKIHCEISKAFANSDFEMINNLMEKYYN